MDSHDAGEQVRWTDAEGQPQQARWRSLAAHPAPARVVPAGDEMGAAEALRLAREGTALLWRGDYLNARHLLDAMRRRLNAQAARPGRVPANLKEAFFMQREAQSQRAILLGTLLLPLDAAHGLALRRAPDLRAACLAAHGPVDEPYVTSLRELLGVVGAFEWRRRGVPVAALHSRIYPHHGVFAPVRGEYVDLVAHAALPAAALIEGACDVGTGSGVLAAVLAQRGLSVVATDIAPRALECARENLTRLKLARQVTLVQTDLFPLGRAGLVVCNPPWIPAQPTSMLDAAVYDPDSRMLRGYLAGLAAHLVPGGEGWLILSDLAEHLGLRSREELLGWIAQGGLCVLERIDVRPSHPRADDASDPLHAARAAEVTSLWRLAATA